jgi:hypothetical protein
MCGGCRCASRWALGGCPTSPPAAATQCLQSGRRRCPERTRLDQWCTAHRPDEAVTVNTAPRCTKSGRQPRPQDLGRWRDVLVLGRTCDLRHAGGRRAGAGRPPPRPACSADQPGRVPAAGLRRCPAGQPRAGVEPVLPPAATGRGAGGVVATGRCAAPAPEPHPARPYAVADTSIRSRASSEGPRSGMQRSSVPAAGCPMTAKGRLSMVWPPVESVVPQVRRRLDVALARMR